MPEMEFAAWADAAWADAAWADAAWGADAAVSLKRFLVPYPFVVISES